MKRLMVWWVALVMLAVWIAPGTAAAQDASVQLIPVTGELLIAKLSPDGHTLAVIDNINMHTDYEVIPEHLPIQLVNLDTGDVTRLTGFTDHAWDIAFTPDGARLVSVHGNGEIIVWDLATATEIARYQGFPGTRGIALLPDNQTAIIRMPSVFAQLTQWNLNTGTITALLMIHYDSYAALQSQFPDDHTPEGIVALAGAPDGTWLAVSSYYGRIWHWDLTSGEPSVLVDTDDTRPYFNIMNLNFTADGSTLIYLDRQAKMIHIIDAATGDVQETIEANTKADPAISPDGSRIIWLDSDSLTFKQWQAGTVSNIPLDLSSLAVPESVNTRGSLPMPGLFLTPDGTRLIFTGFLSESTAENVVAVIDLAG